MLPRILADCVVFIHAAFVAFVVAGGFLAWRWRWVALLHAPAAVWGFLIEVGGWICPLTPLENELRRQAGEAGYSGGFVEHYVVRALYPAGLTRGIQWALAVMVLTVNAIAYGRLIAEGRPRA